MCQTLHCSFGLNPGKLGRAVVPYCFGAPPFTRARSRRFIAMSAAAKRFCFSLTNEEQASPTKLVAFATRVPQIQRTGDQFLDDEGTMKRDAFMKTINYMWRNPDIVMQTASWVEKRVETYEAKRAASGKFEQLSVLKALDDDWCAAFLVGHFGFKRDTLESVCNYDPDSLKHLIAFGLVANLTLKFGEAVTEKDIMEETFLALMKKNEDRLAKVKHEQVVDPVTKGINWPAIGVYKLAFGENGICERVTHMPTGDLAQLPDHVRISRKFVLENNWSDYLAACELKPSRYVLADLFDEGSGPHTVVFLSGQSKEFDTMAKTCKACFLQKKKETESTVARSSVGTTKFREAAKTETKKAAMRKARDALVARKADLSNKRKIKLSVD